MSEGHNPLDQFKVKTLIDLPDFAGHNIDFTNASLFMVIAVLGVILFLSLGVRSRALVPGRLQSMAEESYLFIAGMLKENVGNEGKRYFPLVFSLFMFILFCNLLGMIPGSFTVTSHIIVTFAMAACLFVFMTLLAFWRHGLHFFHFFLPGGVPIILAPLIIVVEMFAYLARPISLSLRLAANMMAGHIMLKVIAGFVVMMGLFGVLPLAFLAALTGFEFFIALLQAYIFTILTCVYLNDAVHMH